MKLSLNLKKGVAIKAVLALLTIAVVLQVVFGQASYVNWASPYYPPGQPSTFGATVLATSPYHILSSIVTSSQTMISVDSNADGRIDNADYARWAGVSAFANDSNSVQGFLPAPNVINKGCVIADTGLQSGGDSFRGGISLDLRINNTVISQIGGNPPSIMENICEDGDGCTYNVIKYSKSAGAPNNVFSNSPRTFFQFPRSTTAAWWIDAGGNTPVSANGDSIKVQIISWAGGAGNNWLDIHDDDSAVETSVDKLTITDRDNSNSFIVYFCD